MIILAHHRINPAHRGALSVTTENFRRQLEYLLERGWRNVSLEAVAAGSEPAGLRERTFAITFDDGYRDNYLHAMPILQEFGLTGTIFVTVDHIDTDRLYPWDVGTLEQWGGPGEEDLSVTWDHIREMESNGTFTIGSHTLTHPKLATLPIEQASQEIQTSKRILEERLGHTVPLFCYPFGNLNRRVIQAVQTTGYSLAVVTPPRPVPRTRYTLPRIGLYENTTFNQFERKAGALYQGLLWAGILPYIQEFRRRRRKQS